jgi:hypothetical protein
MKKRLVGALKFAAACSGPASGLYGIHLFEAYFALGKEFRDEIHTVIINNHGVYRYITEAQNLNFRLFLGLGVLGSLAMFAAIIVTKRRT